jgi:hypothetical protein
LIASVIWNKDLIGSNQPPCPDIEGIYLNHKEMSKQTQIFDTELPFGPLFAQKWAEWLQYRTERKLAKYRPMGLKMALKRIVRESNDTETIAVDMLDFSMEMNYQGIFKRKYATHQRTNESQHRVGTSDARIDALAKW